MKRMKPWQGACAAAAFFVSAGMTSTVFAADVAGIDNTKWQYNAEDDVYYQTGITYVAKPADTNYETMGIFVPGAYMKATANGDGTYTAKVNKRGKAGSYTAKNAPVVMPVETPGYSAMTPPSGYVSDVSKFTKEGMVYLYAGARGRDHGAPAGVTDMKAAIRYLRQNNKAVPGDKEKLFSFGMSGGGAQSALLGATGDSPLYQPYLDAIGAADGSDAILGTMDWCPITSLDVADEAYEWNMGLTRQNLTPFEANVSKELATAFIGQLNDMNLKDENDTPLTLEQSEDGYGQQGTYYEYMKGVVEQSFENFLQDTLFPYDSSENTQMGGPGGPGGPGGAGQFNGPRKMPRHPASTGADMSNAPSISADASQGGEPDFTKMDNIRRNGTEAAVTVSGVYETPSEYIAALNKPFHWIDYDVFTKQVTITSLADFARAMKPASKQLGAFDQFDRGQGENTLFGYGDGTGAHFDAVLGDIVRGSEYETDFAADLARLDALGTPVSVRLDMYNPLYYLLPSYAGYGTSKPAKYWRIRTGIDQGDTSLSTEVNLALAAAQYSPANQVDFATVWGLKHVRAERTGDPDDNFIAWVKSCTAKK